MKPENMYQVLDIHDKITRLEADRDALWKIHDSMGVFQHYYPVEIKETSFHFNEYDILALIDLKNSQINQLNKDLEGL